VLNDLTLYETAKIDCVKCLFAA